ncbi:MAG: hypothetical protein O3C63_00425 [Cyanobacteria bacterium]|nr:hypothetical protein [Cyanobacteriota bacterium]MDA1020883.1 hypothetical protein [Cyanobacteriota bacterium]
MHIDSGFQSDAEAVVSSEKKETKTSSFSAELQELNRERYIIERQLKIQEMIFKDD